MTDREQAQAAGQQPLDSEHRMQMGLVDALDHAVRQRRPRKERDEILDQLITFTSVHFGSERLLMRLHAYPDYDAHGLEHDGFEERLQAFRRLCDRGNDGAILREIGRLRAWLAGHIGASDARLHDHLADHSTEWPTATDPSGG